MELETLNVDEVMKRRSFEGVVIGVPTKCVIFDPKIYDTRYPLLFTLDEKLECKLYFDSPLLEKEYTKFAIANTFMYRSLLSKEAIQVYGNNDDEIFETKIILFPDENRAGYYHYFEFNKPINRMTI